MSEPILDSDAVRALGEAIRHVSHPVSLILRREGRRRGDGGNGAEGGEPGRREEITGERGTALAGNFQGRLAAVAAQLHEGTEGVIEVEERVGVGAHDEASQESATESALLALPALTLRAGDREVVHYLVVPEGPEEPPFLDALALLSGLEPIDGPDLQPDSREAPGDRPFASDILTHLTGPVEMVVFVAPGCPNCPKGVRSAVGLTAASPRITLTVVDGFQFPEHAARFNIQSVPTTIVDGGLTLVGVKTQAELAQKLLELQGSDADQAVFHSLVEAGRFNDAAGYLVDGRALDAFVDLWSRSALESRIGLTLIAEEALDRDSRSLDGLVLRLAESLRSEDPARRGDTADLLGTIGHPDAVPALTALREDSNPDVAEAAEDALEAIEEGGL